MTRSNPVFSHERFQKVERLEITSSGVGAATRIRRHLDLMGAINLEVLLAHKMILMLVIYFSMVRRSAAWASRLSESASLMMTTSRSKR